MLSFALGGIALVASVVFAGHYMGENASARGLPGHQWADVVSPSTTIMRKSSLIDEASVLDSGTIINMPVQQVSVSGKGDFLIDRSLITGPKGDLARLENLIVSPPVWKLEQSWKMGQSKRRKIMAARRNRIAQRACLARAIYFEARSESELGQLAVAKVILNRVKLSRYPNNICGVVYQGAQKKTGCQFSFACDGQSDKPRNDKYWRQAQRVANRAMNGTSQLRVIATATNYHADYVKPKWASTMRRLIKIGRHIFYQGS